MSSFDEVLAAAADGPVLSDPVVLALGGEKVEIVFTRADPYLWAQATALAPKTDAVVDQEYGYNVRHVALTVGAFTANYNSEDGLESLTRDQWTKLLSVISGGQFLDLVDQIWKINEFDSHEALVALGKGSDQPTSGNSDSPES